MKTFFQSIVAALLVTFGVLVVIFGVCLLVIAVAMSPLIWLLARLHVPGAVFNREEIRLWNILKIKLRK